MADLKLEVGKTYVTRDGKRRYKIIADAGAQLGKEIKYPMIGLLSHCPEDEGYDDKGTPVGFSRSGEWLLENADDTDLVAEYVEPIACYALVTLKSNMPMAIAKKLEDLPEYSKALKVVRLVEDTEWTP